MAGGKDDNATMDDRPAPLLFYPCFTGVKCQVKGLRIKGSKKVSDDKTFIQYISLLYIYTFLA
jgi:hypothetical protein